MASIESYLKDVTPSQRADFERVRAIVHSVVPDAEEVLSYGIPTFKYKGKNLVHWGAFKDHVSLFPGPRPIKAFADQLKDYKISKGTIQYNEDAPIPETVIKGLLLAGQRNIEG